MSESAMHNRKTQPTRRELRDAITARELLREMRRPHAVGNPGIHAQRSAIVADMRGAK
jgi:hypothetical protein